MTDPTPSTPPVAHIGLKAALLLLIVLLLAGSALYVLYARGLFEPTPRLVLIAENSEGVVVGMDLAFAGFPIGRVRRIELGDQGSARILVDVPRKNARWLRESSVYTLERGLLGNASLRAYTGIPNDPPLPDGAQKPLLIGDASAEVPRLTSAARELLQNLTALSAADAPLAAALANLRAVSERLNGPRGALGVAMGNDADARKIVALIERSQALVARADGAIARLDGVIGQTGELIARADRHVLGEDGLMRDVRATAAQVNAALGDARAALSSVGALLQELQAVAGNVRVAPAAARLAQGSARSCRAFAGGGGGGAAEAQDSAGAGRTGNAARRALMRRAGRRRHTRSVEEASDLHAGALGLVLVLDRHAVFRLQAQRAVGAVFDIAQPRASATDCSGVPAEDVSSRRAGDWLIAGSCRATPAQPPRRRHRANQRR